MWKFLVKQQKIEVLEREVIADHQIAFVNLKFTFDGDWKKFHKVVQFSQCDEVYNIVLGFDGTSCKLPAELHGSSIINWTENIKPWYNIKNRKGGKGNVRKNKELHRRI